MDIFRHAGACFTAGALLAFLSGCDSRQQELSDDLHRYEGWPRAIADCLAREYIKVASDEQIADRIAMSRGELTPQEFETVDIEGDRRAAVHAEEQCNKQVQSEGVVKPGSISIQPFPGSPLPKPGRWNISGETRSERMYDAIEPRTESLSREICMRRAREAWVIPAGPGCDIRKTKDQDGLVAYQESCKDLSVDGQVVTDTTIKYSATEMEHLIVAKVYSPRLVNDGPAARQTTRTEAAYISPDCSDLN